eukprot:g60062.t1
MQAGPAAKPQQKQRRKKKKEKSQATSKPPELKSPPGGAFSTLTSLGDFPVLLTMPNSDHTSSVALPKDPVIPSASVNTLERRLAEIQQRKLGAQTMSAHKPRQRRATSRATRTHRHVRVGQNMFTSEQIEHDIALDEAEGVSVANSEEFVHLVNDVNGAAAQAASEKIRLKENDYNNLQTQERSLSSDEEGEDNIDYNDEVGTEAMEVNNGNNGNNGFVPWSSDSDDAEDKGVKNEEGQAVVVSGESNGFAQWISDSDDDDEPDEPFYVDAAVLAAQFRAELQEEENQRKQEEAKQAQEKEDQRKREEPKQALLEEERRQEQNRQQPSQQQPEPRKQRSLLDLDADQKEFEDAFLSFQNTELPLLQGDDPFSTTLVEPLLASEDFQVEGRLPENPTIFRKCPCRWSCSIL